MSKHYMPLISLLLIAVFLVAGFAFYKSLTSPQKNPARIALISKAPTASPTGLVAATTSAQLQLEITSPEAEASVSSSLLSVAGKTASEAAVTVNDKTVLVNSEGEFLTSLRLASGPNLLVITASSSGLSRVWQTVVTYTAPKPTDVPEVQ